MITYEKLIEILIQADVDIDETHIDIEKTFEDLGLDSLDVFNYFTEIDQTLGIDVPDEDFEKINSIKDLKDYLNKK